MSDVMLRARSPSASAGPARALVSKFLEPRLLSLATLGVIWLILTQLAPEAVPVPAKMPKIIDEILRREFLDHIWSTIYRLLTGWMIAMVLGLAVGVLMGSRQLWNRTLRLYIILTLSMPGLVWAVLGVVWFGAAIWATVLAVVLVAFPFVVINVYEGVANVDKQLLDMGRVYKVASPDVVRKIVVPSMMPFVVASARQAFSHGWKVTALVEIIGGDFGISREVFEWFERDQIGGVFFWVGIFALILLFVEYGIFGPIQRHLFRWRPDVGNVMGGGGAARAT